MTGFELMIYGALATAAAPPVQTGPLTIDQAVAIAEARAFAIQLQRSGLLRANAVVRQADANLGPQITGTLNANRAGQALFGNFGSVGDPTDPTAPVAAPVLLTPVNTVTAGLTAALPIDISGTLHANLRSAEALRRNQRELLRASVNDTRLNARTAFLDLLRAQATVNVQEQALRNAQAQAEQARLQLEQVQIAKIDVDRLNAAVAQRQSDLIDAQNQQQLAAYQLNLTLARPIETPVEAIEVAALPSGEPDVTVIDGLARRSRPETRAARELIEARAQLRYAAERAQVPNLSLSVSQNRNFGDLGFSGLSNSTSIGVALSVPIYDSGLIRSRVGQARQDEEQAKIQLAQTELNVSQEVRAAVTTLRNARARLVNAERQVLLAQEVFRIAQVRQSTGVGTYVEVVDAETTFTNARSEVVRARYDVLTAYSQLQRAVGDDQITTAVPTPTNSTPAPSTPAGAP